MVKTENFHFEPLTVSVPPSANHYKTYRVVRTWNPKKMTYHYVANWYLTTRAEDYINEVRTKAMVAGWKPIPKPMEVGVEILWFRNQRRGDTENIQKVLLDALQTVAYENDSQIAEIHTGRHTNKRYKNHVVVLVRRLGSGSEQLRLDGEKTP
jgi:Holliday junction resolvase RusA-like endonuclease